MSSLDSLSPRELEWLSAYVDGELAPREADLLRARLEREAALRQALAELRQTAELLRSMPQLKPPRSFALSAARAGARRQYPRLQLATALASLAFILVVGADVLAGRALQSAAISQTAERAMAPLAERELPPVEVQVEKEQAAAEERLQPAPMEVAGTPEPAAAAAGEMAPTPTLGEGLQAAEAPAELEPPAVGYAGGPVPTSPPEAVGPDLSPPPATAEASGERTQEMDRGEPGAVPEGAQIAAAEPAERSTVAAESRVELPAELLAESQESTPAGAGWPLRVVEIGLGIAALVLGGLTIRYRRLI